MTELPAETGVTTPDEASIVAKPVLPLDHAPASPSEVKVVEALRQTDWLPLKFPAFGALVITPETAIFSVEVKPPPVTVIFPFDGLELAEAIRT
jgi:hypothetical protein